MLRRDLMDRDLDFKNRDRDALTPQSQPPGGQREGLVASGAGIVFRQDVERTAARSGRWFPPHPWQS